MGDSLIEVGKKKILQVFNFLNTEGYRLIKSESKDDSSFGFIFNNASVQKQINISITHSKRTNRFFLTIYITNDPYKTVNDYISFDEYLKKNEVDSPATLEKDNQTIESVEKYIEDYTTLFKTHGMELIRTSKQFPGYYPDWT